MQAYLDALERRNIYCIWLHTRPCLDFQQHLQQQQQQRREKGFCHKMWSRAISPFMCTGPGLTHRPPLPGGRVVCCAGPPLHILIQRRGLCVRFLLACVLRQRRGNGACVNTNTTACMGRIVQRRWKDFPPAAAQHGCAHVSQRGRFVVWCVRSPYVKRSLRD